MKIDNVPDNYRIKANDSHSTTPPFLWNRNYIKKEILDWLNDNCVDKWGFLSLDGSTDQYQDGHYFVFARSEDAMLFALKWT